MSIEKFDFKSILPQKKSGIFDRFLAVFAKPKEAPTYLEFYNSDKTRRYSFYEWRDEDISRQLNVSLQYKVGWSWCEIMKAMTRWEGQEEQAFAVEVEALTENTAMCEVAAYLYDLSTGGQKMFTGMWGRPMGVPDDVSEAKKIVIELGFPLEKSLPEYIDFEGTIKQFMLKAKKLDFSNPELIAKSLIK